MHFQDRKVREDGVYLKGGAPIRRITRCEQSGARTLGSPFAPFWAGPCVGRDATFFLFFYSFCFSPFFNNSGYQKVLKFQKKLLILNKTITILKCIYD